MCHLHGMDENGAPWLEQRAAGLAIRGGVNCGKEGLEGQRDNQAMSGLGLKLRLEWEE